MGCVAIKDDIEKAVADNGRRGRLSTVDCRRQSTKVVDMILQNVTIISEALKPAQINFCIQQLKQHQLFNGLSEDQLKAVCSQMVWAQGTKDTYLFEQGQTGHSFFLIQKGRIALQIDKKIVAQLGQNQSFGQLALLFRASRAASVKCLTTETRFFVMKPLVYRNVLQQLKTAEYSLNKQVIQRIALFNCLTNKQKYTLANLIKSANFKAGDIIFQAGQVSQGLYIVSKGQIQISIRGKETLVIGQLQIFGQSALQDNGRRQGKAKCITQATCMVIGKKDVEKALGSNFRSLIYFNIQKWALVRIQEFKKYSSAQLNKIILGFDCIKKQKGSKIQGNVFRGLVIALQGTINLQPEGTIFNVNHWIKGDQICDTLIKDQAGFIGYLSFEKLADIIQQIESKQRLIRASQRCIIQKDHELTLYDFEVVKKLGQGQFGQVFLVQNKKTGGGLYAIKCLNKEVIRSQQMELSVIQEKKILQKAIFPYIVGFVKAFHDKSNIFLLMEFIKGKQMFDVIRQMPTLNKPIARYYFGCLLLALQYLHTNSIIYRDIKPQNSVIDHRGKVYLIDMGTAKQLTSSNMFKTFTIIGTPHYMAPQVFEGKGYSFQADYWSLGILMYQFVCGKLPFGQKIHDDPYKIYGLIRKTNIQFPKFLIDQKVKKLINFLLIKDPKQRNRQVSFQRIKKQAFFEGFSWQDLVQERILPPYVPRDFRTGTQELTQSDGIQFLKHLYSGKENGRVQQWDQNMGI